MRYLNFSQEDIQKKLCYKLADSYYYSELQIDALEGLYCNSINKNQQEFLKTPNQSIQSSIFQDYALIGEKSYHLTVSSTVTANYLLKTGKHEFCITPNVIQSKDSIIDDILLLGPVLILNLALNKVFCLHASAFLIKDKIFILMGDSGTGKSTIARFMNEQKNCQRIADDILPLKIDENRLQVLPNFPQLKLPVSSQYKGDNLVKETILLFAQKSTDNTCLKSLDNFSCIKYLINHSVATKLFAKSELQNHLSFCHKSSTLVKSYRLKYQHSRDSLFQLYSQLNEIV